MTKKTALITGITGQDGAYLADWLLGQGYRVYGGYRRSSTPNFWRIEFLGLQNHDDLHLVDMDLTDLGSLIRVVEQAQPDEIYNLAAQSFVTASFQQPITTSEITGLGATNLLEAIRIVNKHIRFYQASTSEMFGKVQQTPQVEETPFYPRSPYGVAKLYAHWMTVNYREAHSIFASSGILFNHESPLRGKEFVTRKITDSVAKIKLGMLDCIELGNISARRDWGHAKEYVKAMHRMLEIDHSDTFVIATGRTESVREFVKLAFEVADIAVDFEGEEESEIAIDRKSGKTVMRVNPDFYRPAEVDFLVGNAAKAEKLLDWKAQIDLELLCDDMVTSDLRRNKDGCSNY